MIIPTTMRAEWYVNLIQGKKHPWSFPVANRNMHPPRMEFQLFGPVLSMSWIRVDQYSIPFSNKQRASVITSDGELMERQSCVSMLTAAIELQRGRMK
jgi:hypothetical protein